MYKVLFRLFVNVAVFEHGLNVNSNSLLNLVSYVSEACVLLLGEVLRLSLTVTLELVVCEILVFLARLRASSDSRDKAMELILPI